MKILRHLYEFISTHKKNYILGILVLLFVDGLQLITPKLLGYITDSLKANTLSMNEIYIYISIIILLACAIAFFRYIWRMLIMGASRELDCWLRNKFFSHLETLPVSFYTSHKTGDLMAHATNDISAVRMALGPGIVMATDAVFLSFTTIIIMLASIDIRLTAIALIPLPFVAITVTFFGKLIHKRFKKVQETFSMLTDKAQESISGIRVIKSFVQEDKDIESFKKVSSKNVEENMKLIKIHGAMSPLVGFMSTLSFLIALYYGGVLVIDNIITLGQFVSFISYLGILTWPMMAIGWVINMMQRGSASIARLNEILDMQSDISDENVLEIDDLEETIEFRNLTFTYPGASTPALHDISIKIEKGKTLAIIGRTGSGKSTLANLLLHLYNTKKGQLYIGGYDLNDIPLALLRQNIGYIPQDNFLFSCSIRDNIAFSDLNMSKDILYNAAKTAEIYKDIEEFPDGFETIVGERGITLSGGQKQRVSIARAIAKNPKILILDDCLSAVDTKTEECIIKNLRDAMKDKTAIVIAHRISTIRDADWIIVLDEGRIAEQGTHRELVALEGLYNSIYQKQLLEDKLSEAE